MTVGAARKVDGVRSAVAVPIDDTAVFVTMRRGDRGPWSVISDEPSKEREARGPTPGYLALAGIAACTIVTVAGVASRRGPELADLRVSFAVAPRADGGFDIRQRTALGAELSETDHLRLERTARHCPIGKIFTKRVIAIEDTVEIRREPGLARAAARDRLPVFVPGTVEAKWLPETREWAEKDGARVLEEEGEATLRIEQDTADRRQRFAMLGGHGRVGWAPRPSSFATAALAASTLMTLRAHARDLGIAPGTLRVEVRVISDVPVGGKRASQDAASEGVATPVHWLRAVTVAGSAEASDARIRQTMAEDPIYGYCMRGDLLVADEVVALPDTRTPVR